MLTVGAWRTALSNIHVIEFALLKKYSYKFLRMKQFISYITLNFYYL